MWRTGNSYGNPRTPWLGLVLMKKKNQTLSSDYLRYSSLADVPEVQVSRVQEVALVNHVPHPLAVVHVTLTSLYAGE